jgi:hypothetical protein
MKKILSALLALSIAPLASAGNYILSIDGTAYEIDLGQQKNVKTKNGMVLVSLTKKTISTFSLDGVSFDYPSTLSPSSAVLSSDAKQVMMIEGTGNLFLLQIYKGIDGSLLVPLLEKELTKEEVSAGYKKTSRPIDFKLDNGDILHGKFVHTQDSTNSYDRYIVGCATKSGGVVAVVQKSNVEVEGIDKDIVNKTLKSLKANCSKS